MLKKTIVYALKQDPANDNKEIKIERGVLLVDKIVVDRNTFFV